ncbi:MAG TPA: hypothetical protein PLB55_17490, partial [Prosthecobacter sp.]|nr:hypothetical protein [Prosthecobacter sp.]
MSTPKDEAQAVIAEPPLPTKPGPIATAQDHDHGFAPPFLPHWMQERWAALTVAVAGSALMIGFFGEKFFGLPASVALGFYLLSYLAGGYDVARAALPALF